ncbi:hypothetical protein MMC17_007731 [Xylographa soralifera]|nr:hypothetical protein [Xylographa soralifera]
MEETHKARAISSTKENEQDRVRSSPNDSTVGLAEENSETSKMMMHNEITIDNESDPTTPAQGIPAENQLGSSTQVDSDADEITGRDMFQELMAEISLGYGNEIEAEGSLRALTNNESPNSPDAVDVTNDIETLMEHCLNGCEELSIEEAERLKNHFINVVLHNGLPLNEAAALALILKPGSLRFEDYTVSWKPSNISCFVEYAYQYENYKFPKIWLVKASLFLLQDPGGIARILQDEYVIEQFAKEQAVLGHDLEDARAKLRRNIHVTADAVEGDWVEIACKAKRHKALIRETNEAITKLRTAGFTRVDLTLEKLSEFALNINSAELDLSTLVEYIISLPLIMEVQSEASTAAQSGGLDAQSLSDPVTHTAKRRKERKLKKKQAQQHASQVMKPSQTEAMSNTSALLNNTIPVSVDQDEPMSPETVLDDHSNTAEHTPLSTKKKNKKKKKDKKGKAQAVAADLEEAVDTADLIPGDQKEVVDTADSHQMSGDHEKAVETVETHQILEGREEASETADTIPGDHEGIVEIADPHQMPEDHEEVSKTAETTSGSHEEVVETADLHQQYPVFPLAEPSLVAMRNSPTTYAHRTVQRPIDHRKIRSMTELELQKLQLPSEHLAEAKERLLSEPSPMSLEEVRDLNREIAHHSYELEQENSRKTREIVGLIRERSRSHEAELLSRLNDQTSLPDDHAVSATQEASLHSSDQQAFDLDTHSTSSTELLSVPVVTRRQSMRRIITSSPLPTISESRFENSRPLSAEDLALRTRVIHRRCHSEPQHTFKTKVDPAPLGGADDNEDLSDDEAEDPQHSRDNGASSARLPLREQHPYTPWTTLLDWKYYSNDQELRAIPPGTHAYRFPRPVRVSAEGFRAGNMSDCPVYLFPRFTDNDEPKIEYNEVLDCYEITPHSRPWREDLRSDSNHPDYLPPGKLCQYQAYEFAGFTVWRHDRDPFFCKLSSCGQTTRDHDITTMICHGCGTKSRVRYCSKAHLIRDIPNHWKICGTPAEVYGHPIDPGSQPDRFYRRYPAIIDVDEDPVTTTDFKNRSFQKHRQQTFAIFNKGQYTLFLGGSTRQIVEWPENVAKVYKPRVERLLNMAFFRQANTGVVEYLFYLMRYCLRLQKNWTDATEQILKIQFKLEFNYDTRLGPDADPCECVWSGAPALVKGCTPSCRAQFFDKFGLVFGGGLKAHLEFWEARHFPLRIWQRQHPTIRGWEYRLRGEGFPGVPEYQQLESAYVPTFGKGWEGFGAEDADPRGTWRLDD